MSTNSWALATGLGLRTELQFLRGGRPGTRFDFSPKGNFFIRRLTEGCGTQNQGRNLQIRPKTRGYIKKSSKL